MDLPIHILLTYGYVLLFGWVLIEQMGIPLPATPLILAAGALSAQHQINYFLALLAGFLACVVADSAWFYIGKQYGHKVVRVLCKLSLEPQVCVRRTESSLGIRRRVTLIFAKFIPGVATVISPLAGRSGMPFREFLLLDGLGSLLWMATLLETGRLFGDVLKRNPGVLNEVGKFAGLLLVTGIVGWFLMRLWRRNRTLRRLAASRLEPEELKQLIDNGELIYIVDLRHPLELADDPYTLPGAHRSAAEKVREWALEIPNDASVVVFCSCPGELTAAKTALALQKFGIERVRPLRGGYDAWKQAGFPVDAVPAVAQPLVQLGN